LSIVSVVDGLLFRLRLLPFQALDFSAKLFLRLVVTGASLASLGFVDKAHSVCILVNDSAWRSVSGLSKLLFHCIAGISGVLEDSLRLGLAPRVADHFFAELLSTIVGSRAEIPSSSH